jgi:hypothetical protein
MAFMKIILPDKEEALLQLEKTSAQGFLGNAKV